MFGPCFVVHNLVSFLVLQSSRGGRESCLLYFNCYLSYDVGSESEITPCNKIDKPVVYRFTGNVMTSITALRT